MTEYLLIVGLVAVSSVAVLTATSINIQKAFARIGNAIAGEESNIHGERITTEQYKKRDMSNFDDGAAFAEE